MKVKYLLFTLRATREVCSEEQLKLKFFVFREEQTTVLVPGGLTDTHSCKITLFWGIRL